MTSSCKKKISTHDVPWDLVDHLEWRHLVNKVTHKIFSYRNLEGNVSKCKCLEIFRSDILYIHAKLYNLVQFGVNVRYITAKCSNVVIKVFTMIFLFIILWNLYMFVYKPCASHLVSYTGKSLLNKSYPRSNGWRTPCIPQVKHIAMFIFIVINCYQHNIKYLSQMFHRRTGTYDYHCQMYKKTPPPSA